MQVSNTTLDLVFFQTTLVKLVLLEKQASQTSFYLFLSGKEQGFFVCLFLAGGKAFLSYIYTPTLYVYLPQGLGKDFWSFQCVPTTEVLGVKFST